MAFAAFAAFSAVPVAAQAPVAAPPAAARSGGPASSTSLEGCVSRRDAISQVRAGLVMPLRELRRTAEEAAKGEMINAALCARDGRTVYVVTVLGTSGKVANVTLDARNGQLLSVR